MSWPALSPINCVPEGESLQATHRSAEATSPADRSEHCPATSSPASDVQQPDRDGNGLWGEWIRIAPAVATSGGGGGGRVLLISYTFPPTGGSGVQRPAKLCTYLPRYHWNVEVLTAGHHRFPWHDASLLADLPADMVIHRVAGYEPACLARSIAAPFDRGRLGPCRPAELRDEGNRKPSTHAWLEDRLYWRLLKVAQRWGLDQGEEGWIQSAVQAALCRHRRHPFDVIISTGPPVFVHRVGLAVARQARVPWIADVRDPFVSDFDLTAPGRRLRSQRRRLERLVMRQAELVTTTCEALADDFRMRHPQRRPDSIQAITNGFDRVDLREGLAVEPIFRPDRDVCTFVAAGAFYGRRDLRRIIEPMERVLARHPRWQGKVQLVVAGTLSVEQHRRVARVRPEWMRCVGYCDHAQAVRLACDADCSIVLVPDCRHARHCIPGKLFELMALPTHLLGLVPPDSETEQIIRTAGAATCVAMEDDRAIETALTAIIRDRLEHRLSHQRPWPQLDDYDRLRLAGRFASLMNRLKHTRVANTQD